jgi:hypothetical protein
MPLLNKYLSKKPEITSKEFIAATNFTNKSTAHKLQKKPCLSILHNTFRHFDSAARINKKDAALF